MTDVRVLIVDDHEVVRLGLQAYLEEQPGIRCVGEAVDGASALAALERLAAEDALPDVVLMDLVMRGQDGISATREIRVRYPVVQVVAVTSFGESQRIRDALAAGASGYVMKDSDVDEIAIAIHAAAQGAAHLDAATERTLSEEGDAGREDLTAREREVLALVAEGLSNRQAARSLSLSERTVQTHLGSILRKLGLKSRTEAALWAVRGGLRELD
ncbi:response regulator transcription factor [Granulicoccus sp. GXG6511]|uniref:response regulator transcription factor n=1 Tax=Granulicoccus sp. GXG6511 TaxID=3381351 RepID=UPI003D7EB52C